MVMRDGLLDGHKRLGMNRNLAAAASPARYLKFVPGDVRQYVAAHHQTLPHLLGVRPHQLLTTRLEKGVAMRSLRLFVVSGVLLLAFAPTTSALAQASGTCAATGSMPTVSSAGASTTTLLHNGQVLVVGGGAPGSTSADLYNPATGTWAATGSMTTARSYASFSATLLQGGEVLFTGGENASSEPLASADLYNPATGTFSPTGTMTSARFGASATLLANGEVLVAGGINNAGTYLSSAELYDPASGSWSTAARFADIGQFAVTLLGSGKVLLAGGLAYSPRPTHSTAAASLYNPATNTWQATGAMTTPRSAALAVLLQSGQVLVAGGNDIGKPSKVLTSAELYQP